MTDKNHVKIWNKIKPTIDSIEVFMNLFIFNAQDMGNKEEEYRLSNLKRTYCRGIMMAESAKYLPIKNKPTREGYDFNALAIVYCYEQVFKDIAKKNKELGHEIPTESQTREEAKRWALLGIHPEITDAAIKAYNEGGDCMSPLAVFVKDKSLDFSAPAAKAVKGFFKKLF